MRSKIGSLYLVASDTGLEGIFWERQNVPMVSDLRSQKAHVRILQRAVSELEEYFDGQRKKFTVPLEAQGTAFQKRVWSELRRIPYGQTASYKDIAGRIRRSKAMRAVGTANGCNPHAIIVPCHRVIAHDGTLGGYAGGLKTKVKLLEIEGVKV